MTRTSETKRAAQQSVAPRFVRAVSAYAASDADCVRVAGKPSSLEAASSQTWASCTKDTRTSFAFASRAHLKHSSAIVRYSVAVFMGRCASRRNSLAGFPKLVCRRPDSTKELLASLVNLRRIPGSLAIFAARSAAPHRTPHVRWRLNSSGSFAIFTAIRLASCRSNNFAADLRPGSSSK
jgi:hypothetical protein